MNLKKLKFLIISIIFFFSCTILYAITHDSAPTEKRDTVLIYNDDGIFPHCYILLSKFFSNRGYTVKDIKSTEIISKTDWTNNCEQKILAFPGGADRFYHQKLSGQGCEKIKKFVANGGAYVGVCGGSYFGTAKVEFALGLPEQVNQDRELGFFPGIARGPAKGIFKYENSSGVNAAEICITKTNEKFFAYHNGGPTFVPFEDDPDFKKADPNFLKYEILATFAEVDNKPAIIKCNYGKGYAILSGVHFENSSKELNDFMANEKGKKIEELVASTENIMNKFLDEIFPQVT